MVRALYRNSGFFFAERCCSLFLLRIFSKLLQCKRSPRPLKQNKIRAITAAISQFLLIVRTCRRAEFLNIEGHRIRFGFFSCTGNRDYFLPSGESPAARSQRGSKSNISSEPQLNFPCNKKGNSPIKNLKTAFKT